MGRVPFPNSSKSIKEREVELRKAKETWFKSIMKADCTCIVNS